MGDFNNQEQNYQNYQGPQSQGHPHPGGPTMTPPPANHLAGAIVATILCCWPFGIPAIVNAAKVNRLWYSGDQAGAMEAAHNAHKWMVTSIIFGVIFGAIYLVYVFIVGAASMML